MHALIEFTVGNFLSFKDRKTFSMEATRITEFPDNVVEKGGYRLLRSAVIYGANSSGKSNLIKAMKFMVETILNSSKQNSNSELNVKPFMLDEESKNLPSYFEILILCDDIRYRYGFELDNTKIHSEWFFCMKEDGLKEEMLFIRQSNSIAICEKSFPEGIGLEERTRDNGLYLSVCDQFNGSISHKLMMEFGYFKILSGLDHTFHHSMTFVYMEEKHPIIKTFFQSLKLGFTDIEIPKEEKQFSEKAFTSHNVYDSKGNVTGNQIFNIVESESSGTNKIFDLAGYIVFSLMYGLSVVIDELDAKLHPVLTKKIVEMFNSPDTNKRGAQILFTTHDTNLLSCDCFRRDQIWFTEKDHTEKTDLYSLVEFKEKDGTSVRKDRSFEKDYIKGRYGAIPFLGDFTNLFDNGTQN